MFCPRCGQERNSHATSFCSRCGFLLTSVAELIQTGGVQSKDEGESLRSRGIRMGIFMLLLLIVIAPIVGIVSVFLFRTAPWLMGVSIFLLGGGGILRIAYALMFESSVKRSSLPDTTEDRRVFNEPRPVSELPPQRDLPASAYSTPDTGKWLDTNELGPTSVTEGTTKLLEKDQ